MDILDLIAEGEFKRCYIDMRETCKPYGENDNRGNGDYWVMDDDYGCRQHRLYINNLELLRTPLVEELYDLVRTKWPEWSIMFIIAIEDHWPDMGMIIEADGIKDDLQRKFFPADYQSLPFDKLPRQG